MPELVVPKMTEIEIARREANQLSSDPYIKEVFYESHQLLQKFIGFPSDKFNLNRSSFITFEDRVIPLLRDIVKDDLVLGEFRKRKIPLKDEHSPAIPYYMVIKDKRGEPDNILITSQPFVRRFSEVSNSALRSEGSIMMFECMAGAIIDDISETVDLEVDRKVLVEMGMKAIAGVKEKSEDILHPELIKLTSEISSELLGSGELVLQAKGARVRLLLNDRVLKTYYEDEASAMEYLILENVEDRFIRRMEASKVKGKKWFVAPDQWPQNMKFRKYRESEAYSEMNELVESGDILLLENFLNANMASHLLNRDNIAHSRRVKEVIPQEAPVSAPVVVIEEKKPLVVLDRKTSRIVEKEKEASVILSSKEEAPKPPKKEKKKKKKAPPPKPQNFKKKKGRIELIGTHSNGASETPAEVEVAIPTDVVMEVGEIISLENNIEEIKQEKKIDSRNRNNYRKQRRKLFYGRSLVERDALNVVNSILFERKPFTGGANIRITTQKK